MQKKKEKRTSKEHLEQRRNTRRWVIFGGIGFLAIMGILGAFICICQPFVLKGVNFSVESGFYGDVIDV